MKKRIILLCAAVCGLAILVFLRKGHGPEPLAGVEYASTNGVTGASLVQATTDRKNSPSLPDGSNSTIVSLPPDSSEDTNAYSRSLLAAWQSPIDFYGMVVDESNGVIAQATVQFQWSETPSEGGSKTAEIESDTRGLFSLTKKTGHSLEVRVSKAGYYTPRPGFKNFTYSIREQFSPDPSNPVIFKLRRKGNGTELITSENGMRTRVAVRIPKDGTSVRVDLPEKKASTDGQLEISQNKSPARESAEWSFRMKIPDGGFIENEDEFPFEAPETSYLPAVEYHFTKTETNWTTQVSRQFYIAFGQPRKYGWLRIESNLAQETIFLTYAINPTGSRNLEPKEQ